MKKYLLAIVVMLAFFQNDLYAQQSTIKVEQYKVIIDRTVTHNSSYNWYSYDSKYNIGQYDSSICFAPGSSGIPGRNNDYCFVEKRNCTNCNLDNKDELVFKLSKNNIPQSNNSIGIANILMSNIPKGTTKLYSDTLQLFQPQFDITSIANELYQMQPFAYQSYYYDINWDTGLHSYLKDNSYFSLSGDNYDRTVNLSPYSGFGLSARYNIVTRVRVIPSLDRTYNLPSHDKITMVQTATGGVNHWEYKTLQDDAPWKTISNNLASGSNKEKLTLSGVDILSSNYTTYLNSNIAFRAVMNSGSSSEAVTFTLLLSSPHIISTTPTHLNCYDRNEGSIKINFDRPLLTGEKLNILLYDTLNRVNFSTFNITQFSPGDNSYTWKQELRAGLYAVNLLGKYAKGIEYDLNVNNREDTVSVYTALNSVNFEDNFNTTDASNFNAFTDFEGYSQSTYTGGINHFAFQPLTQPTKIRYVVKVDNNVLCKGTAAGTVTVTADGGLDYPDGKKHYKYSLKNLDTAGGYAPFVNITNTTTGYVNTPEFFSLKAVTQQITNLRAGHYLMRLRDDVDCFAKDSAGNEVTYAFTITEPEKGITIDQLEVSPVTSADSANGRFNIKISGGTPYNTTAVGGENVYDEAYIVQLRDSATNTLLVDKINYTDTTIANVYNMQTGNLAEGTYILRVFDKSYRATDPYNMGCFLEVRIPFKKPLPLLVHISQRKQISCFSDKNGELVASVIGGIQNDTTRYKYQWYRLRPEGNITLPVASDTSIKVKDSVITGLAIGKYRVEVTDKYNNKRSDTFELLQPAPMQLQFTTTPATCYSSFDGSMSVTVNGGTHYTDPARLYNYEWSNGSLLSVVNNVPGGNYLVVVRDSMGCVAQDTVNVTSPVRVIAKDTVLKKITCYNSNDGSLGVSATGGIGAYSYNWSNGAATPVITNLAPGRYWYTVTDANGCFDTDTLLLAQPDTILVNLGPDRKLCLGQVLRLNGKVANTTDSLTYAWQGSSTNFTVSGPKANITGVGTYTLSVSNTTGCTIRDTIVVTSSADSVNTDFIVSTQAFKNESVILINLSYPNAQDSVLWQIPPFGSGVSVLSQSNRNTQLLFADTGRFELGMKVYYTNGCIDDTTKFVNVITRDNLTNLGSGANAYLKLYAVVIPNPNSGTFKVNMTFSEPTRARLRLINTLTNTTVDTRDVTVTSTATFSQDYSLSGTTPGGVYILVIDTPKGSFVYKIVIV